MNRTMFRKLMAGMMIVALTLAATGCGGNADGNPPPVMAPPNDAEKAETPTELNYAKGTVLRMATGYNSPQTGLSFDA